MTQVLIGSKRFFNKLFVVYFILNFSVLFSLFLFSHSLHAQLSREDQNASVHEVFSVNEIISKMKQNKESIQLNEIEQRKLLSILYEITKKKKNIIKKRGYLTDNLFAVKANINNLVGVISQLQQKSNQQKKKLMGRVRILYTIGKYIPLELIFSSRSVSDLDKSLRFIKIMTDFDYELLKNYQENILVISKQKERLNSQVKRLVGLENKIELAEYNLKEQYGRKSKLLGELKSKTGQYIKNMEILKGSVTKSVTKDERVHLLLSKMMDSSFFDQKKFLPAPIDVPVTYDFGILTHPQFKYILSHKGFYYQTMIDTPIRSIFNGKVVFLGMIPGYGKSMIVNHGDNYYSLYANEIIPKVSLGDPVSGEEIIGYVGSSIYRDPGLYFEIRHFSEPEDPKNWIRSDRITISHSESETFQKEF